MYVSRGALSPARARASAVVLGAALLVAGCSSADDGEKPHDAGSRITQQPKGADPFWVNPDGTAARQVAAYEKSGATSDAEQIRKIAEQPTGEWIGPENPALTMLATMCRPTEPALGLAPTTATERGDMILSRR